MKYAYFISSNIMHKSFIISKPNFLILSNQYFTINGQRFLVYSFIGLKYLKKKPSWAVINFQNNTKLRRRTL